MLPDFYQGLPRGLQQPATSKQTWWQIFRQLLQVMWNNHQELMTNPAVAVAVGLGLALIEWLMQPQK